MLVVVAFVLGALFGVTVGVPAWLAFLEAWQERQAPIVLDDGLAQRNRRRARRAAVRR